MAVARYWRLIGIEPQGGGDLALSEVALYDGVTRVDGSATLTSTIAPTSGSLANLKDADLGTSATFAADDLVKPGFALMWDFGSAQNVSGIKFGSLAVATFVWRYEVQRSDNGVTWTFDFYSDGLGYDGNGVLQHNTSADPLFDKVTMLLDFEGIPLGVSGLATSEFVPRTLFKTLYGVTACPFVGGSDSIPYTSVSRVLGHRSLGNSVLTFSAPTISGDFCFEFRFNRDSTNNDGRHLFSFGATGPYLFQDYASGVFTIRLRNGSDANVLSMVCPTNVMAHIAWTRQAGQNKIWVNGVGSAAWTDTTSFTAGSVSTARGASFCYGYFDDIRLTVGDARYTANFTPSAQNALPNNYPPSAFRSRLQTAAPSISAYTPPATVTLQPAQPPSTLDMQDGGLVAVVGDVKKLGLPTHVPLRRRVRLYHKRDARFIRETWSDAATGAFAFTGLRAGEEYNAITYDHLGQYRAVAVDKIFGA